MNAEKQPRVLVIDDEEDMRDILSRILGGLGCEVSCAASAEEAVKTFLSGPFDGPAPR